ncbi:hypothetical protein B0J13DRAFT_445022 [Dactylonectria estremocensis]|uniref:Uncharacterized protein n=1 Tax=Dactylonectria estremocensis TaxID=1079267 RepID=A0A9P9EQP9_9HYPO|nr:hypothetical protein B0J13DRAFT_445022 [Dactylonectria estremocensis]
MVFTSRYPDINYPRDLTVWEWAFEDPRYSPLFRYPRDEVAGFTNGATGERLDFFQVKEHSTHVSIALVEKYGLQVTDTVALFSQNTIWYPVAMFATLRVGGRVSGASPSYSVDEMTGALRTAKAKFIMTVPSSIEVALGAAKRAGIPREHIFLLEGELHGYTSMKQLLEIGKGYGEESQTPFFRVPKGEKNDICGFLNFSSGTTGLPKAVMLSHKNAIAQCLQLRDVAGPGKKRFLAGLPLFHISGLIRFLHWPIAGNDECVMLPQFTIKYFLETIVNYQITDLTLVPSIVIRLVRDPVVDSYDLTCVRTVACGAAPLGQDVLQQLQAKMPWVGFRQSYGMTESCCCLSTHPPEFYDFKYGNNGGMLLGSTVIKVIDLDTGAELGAHKTGEILAKGPQIAMGYLGNAKETADTFGADGFLHTGDIGSIDEAGFIRIVDRIKEMIKVKGQQVAPAELEHLLLEHPGVNDCAVLGVPDEYSAERPKAYVMLRPNVEPTDVFGRELMDYVKERRVRYKWLKEIEFVDDIPRNPSGKILRRILRDKERKRMSYTGETAYITGGASGIARALAISLAMFVADRNLSGAEEVAKDLNEGAKTKVAWAVQVDVADWESQKKGFEAAVKQFGRIDYVFPIAGIPEISWLPNRPKATEFEKPNLAVLEVNTNGALYTSALAIQLFRRQEPNQYGFRGKIVIAASGAGFYYIKALPVYTAAKHAVVGFVRSFGKYLPDEKITLNAMCPNIVKTSISTGDFYDKADARGLLVTMDSVVQSFENLLGTNTMSGEAIEILPGDEGWRIKERAPFTNEKCQESVEMTHNRSHRSYQFHQPVEE